MVFNINYFNAGNAFIQIDGIPTPSTYSKITLFGGAHFDDLHGLDYVMTQTEIDNLDFDSSPVWDINTILLALFNGNLQAGNIDSLPSPITGWDVLRRGTEDAKFVKLAEIPADQDTYVDELAKSSETYTYRLLPKTDTEIGTPLEAEDVDTDFTKIVLLEEGGDGYSFCLDLRLSEIGSSEDIGFNDTRGQYPTYQKGNQDYHQSSVGAIVTSNAIDAVEIEQDDAYLRKFEEFLKNGNEKIIKYPYGHIYRVLTSNVSMTKKTGEISTGKSLYLISFTWTEVGSVL